MIGVEHQLDVGPVGFPEHDGSLGQRGIEIAGSVTRVERLQQQGEAVRRGFGRSFLQVLDEHLAGGSAVFRADLAGHAVDGRAAGLDAELNGLVHGGLKLRLAPDERPEPVLARCDVAPHRVDAKQLETVSRGALAHVCGRHVVRPVQLNGLEAGRSRGVDLVEQRTVRPEEAEIGGETRHRPTSA